MNEPASIRRFCSVVAASLAIAMLGGCRQEARPAEAAVQLEQVFPEGQGSDAIRVAIAATKSGDYAAGVVALESAKAAPGLTGAQLAAMEQAAQAITADLTRRADAGDAVARAHLAAIEKSRSQ